MFTSEPEEYASFREELIFEYSQEESSDLLFEIELGENEGFREVKKLYDTSSAKINVAPMVAAKFLTTPTSGATELCLPTSGYGQVRVMCGDTSTTSKYFVAARGGLPSCQGVLSRLPQSRFINYMDYAELWIYAEEGSNIEAYIEITHDGGTEYEQYSGNFDYKQLYCVRLNTSSYPSHTKSVKITIEVEFEITDVITFYYTPKIRDTVRLAWIGELGGIEHYTFPVANSIKLYQNGVREYEVESAFEASQTIEALSDIITSEKVWLCEDGQYIEVNTLSDQMILNNNGELSTAIYKFERYD